MTWNIRPSDVLSTRAPLCPTAIRQALAKAIVAFYQKCEWCGVQLRWGQGEGGWDVRAETLAHAEALNEVSGSGPSRLSAGFRCCVLYQPCVLDRVIHQPLMLKACDGKMEAFLS